MLIESHNPYDMRLGKHYGFKDLPEKYQEKLIEDQQEFERELFSETSKTLLEDINFSLKKLAIEVDHFYYSGFWSQGDGACFTGTVTAEDGIRLEAEKDYPEDSYYIQTAEELEEAMLSLPPKTTIHISHRGRYYHEHSVNFDFEFDEDELEKWTFTDEDKEEAMKGARKSLRDLMQWIYRQLEKEYDHVTSETTAIESLSERTWAVGSRLELTQKLL